MTREEIIAELKPIISIYAPETADLSAMTEKSDFINDLKINSANLVDIVLDVEEHFNIDIDNQAMEKMLTVEAVIDVISERIS